MAKLASPPAVRPTPVKPLTIEGAKKLLKRWEQDPLRALYILALSVGLRRSELLGLYWTDIDLEEKTVTVRRGRHYIAKVGTFIEEPKSVRSRRTVALPDLAVSALKDHERAQKLARLRAADVWEKTDCVFVGPTGRPLLPYAITKAFTEHAKAVGLPDMTFHQLRHGAATLMLASGVSLKVAQENLGHSTYAITADIYGHVAQEVQRLAASAIDRALGSRDEQAV